MVRDANSPQTVWQLKFQEYPLNPFTNEKAALRYQRMDIPEFWWYNPVNPDSLRLTRPAFNVLEKARVQKWQFKVSRAFLPKTYLQLEKYFTAPYYIHGQQTIYVYGETEAIMLGLHGSNLQQYLDNLSL